MTLAGVIDVAVCRPHSGPDMNRCPIRRAAAAAFVVCLLPATTRADSRLDYAVDEATSIAQAQPGWIPQWDTYYGGFRQLDELAARADGFGWGVDVVLADQVEHSIFVRFSEGEVRALQTEKGFGVRALTLTNDSGWAVGDLSDRGAVYAIAGGSSRWSRVAGAAATLHGVAVVAADPSRGWAVGDQGTVLVLGPAGWSSEAFPDRLARLRAVAGLSVDEAWAIEERGYLWHRTAAGWTRLEGLKIDAPLAMAFSGDGRGLVVGKAAFAYSGGAWSPIAAPGARATSVAWVRGAAYAAVDGGVARWDGSVWSPVPLPTGPVRPTLVDQIVSTGSGWVASDRQGALVVAMPDPVIAWPFIKNVQAIDAHLGVVDSGHLGLAWAGGTSLGAAMVGSVPRDGAWDLTLPMPDGSGISGVSLLSETEGWAIGAEFLDLTPRTAMWHLTDQGWIAATIDANWGLTSVQTLAADDAWASGNGTLARWNGDSWKLVDEAPFGTFTGPLAMVRGGDDPEGWFAVRGGVFHLVAHEWHRINLAPSLAADGELLALAADPAGGVWALAPEHVLRVAQDETFELMPDPPATLLRDVSVSPLGIAWVLAEPEGLFRFDAGLGQWEDHPLGVAGDRVAPLRIQALDQAYDPSRPPPDGWEGHDVWITGAASAVARFRIAKPSFRAFLPSLERK